MTKQATLFSFFRKPSAEKSSNQKTEIKHDHGHDNNNDDGQQRVNDTALDDVSELNSSNHSKDKNTERIENSPKLFSLHETKKEDMLVSDDEPNSPADSPLPHEIRHSNEYQLSEYEQLRLRNIQRNHDRLVALGLADPYSSAFSLEGEETKHSKSSTKKRKTTIRTSDIPTTKAVRRSTRNRNVRSDEEVFVDASISDTNSTDKVHVLEIGEEKEEDVPLFTDSPLVQYTMTSESSNLCSAQHMGKISSLSVDKARFIAPKSNLAWYSMDLKTNGASHLAVAAGKAGIISLWNYTKHLSSDEKDTEIEPILSWKGHNGRWIADAKFVTYKHIHSLLTASNDGCLSLWDLKSVNAATGVPRCLATTGKYLHSSGIFSMDVNLKGHDTTNIMVATGSKDKTVAVTPLENIGLGSLCKPSFVSNYHSSKVGCVHMQGWGSHLIGSASDDGSFAVHDMRSRETPLQNDYSHWKPHSFVWHPTKQNVFMTAGYGEMIHVWDMRYSKDPTFTCKGHVPNTVKKIKRIHRPTFLQTTSVEGTHDYILTGSENSQCLSIYECNYETTPGDVLSLYSRGNLPNDCIGDVCCITSTPDSSSIYVSLSDGDIILLHPK